MSGAGFGTGPLVVAMPAIRRRRDKAAFIGGFAPVSSPVLADLVPAGVPVPVAAPALEAGRLGQTHNYKHYVTGVNATGVSAAGPPRRRGPA